MTAPHDVTEVSNEGAQTDAAPSDVQATPQHKGMGPLLEEQDDKKVVDALVQILRDEAPARKRRRAEWECYKLWLRGIRGVRVRRTSEDFNSVELVVPLGAYDLQPVMDRTDELLEKVVAHLLADPALPDAEPVTDADSDRDAAEFTTRLLTVEGSESGYNNQAVLRRAERKAGVHGSGFIYPMLDPQGGGWRPMEIRALPMAQTTQDAAIDPDTGQSLGADDERLKTRYVMPGGQLTDDPSQADRQWLPKIVPEVLTGEQVVLIPPTCSGINDATGVLLIRFTPLGKLKAMFPEKIKNDQTLLQKLVEWRPEDSKHAQPDRQKSIKDGRTESGKVKDTSLVCTLSLYYKSHGAYPKGAYICAAGGDIVLHKQAWSGMVEGEKELREECLELPLSQVRQFDDDIYDDPYGYGLVRKLGPADEVRGDIVLAWQEYLDKFLHPIPFLPLGSIVQPDQLAVRDDTAVFFNPQGKPEYEKIEAFPVDAKEFFDRVTQSQNSSTFLEEAAQGVDTQTATSGVAKQIVVQQALVNMATLRQNAADGQERLWRIIAQIIRVFYTVPMKLKYQGDDGSYKEREWSRADLGSTKDIRIARGSFTQQSPEQKQLGLDNRFAQQLIDPEEYDRLSSSNIRATIGIQDNPHRMRVRRQLAKWREGPPPNWQPAAPPGDPLTGQPAIDAATGQPLPPEPDPENPFADARLVDQEQDVARIRYLELRREVAGTGYVKKPPEWRAFLDNEYTLMRQAAGVTTLAEQAEAQAMQQEQQMAAEQEKQGAEIASKERQSVEDRSAQSEESEAKRSFDLQMADREQAAERERMAMEQQGAPVPA